MPEFPLWFNPDEYADFITESPLLFEVNVPLQKQKFENRKKMNDFDRQTSLRRNNLKIELMRDAGQAKAKGIAMGLGEEFKQKMTNAFYNKLLEDKSPIKSEKHKMRPEVDPADRERDRKRESRRQEKESGLKNILIVKNKSLNRVEIIQKSDFDPKYHEVIKGKTNKMDKGSVTAEDLKRYSQRSDFRNTKTSIRILGKIQKIEQDEQQDEQDYAQATGQEPAGGMQSAPPPPPPRPRVPSNGKEITDIDSTYPDWDHTPEQFIAGIPEILNTLSGTEMSPEMQQMLSDSRTLGDTLNRFVKQFIKEFPDAGNYEYELVDKPYKPGKLWSSFGVKQAKAKATFFAVNGDNKIGFAVKIGKQVRPGEKGEAGLVYNTILQAIDPSKIFATFGLMLKDLVANLQDTFAKQITPPVFDQKQQAIAAIAKQTWEKENYDGRTSLFVNKCQTILEDMLNKESGFKKAFLNESLSGNLEFEGKEGIANNILYMNKDGSNTKIIPIADDFLTNLAKTVEFVLKFNNTPIPPESPMSAILQQIGQLNEGAMQGVKQFEDILKQVQNPLQFMQMLGVQIQDATFTTPVDYSDCYFGNTDTSNTVVFDPGTSLEKQVSIPVTVNFSAAGDEEPMLEKGADELLESYMLINDLLVDEIKNNGLQLLDALIILDEQFNLFEKRNYRKEYDNYHSKPEQRKNRSKRVMARRKMEKKGKVKKGDGKDVDHKDGNPKNNNDKNLRVLSKSKNRSMNEDHGAGFEGTQELVDKLVSDTPGGVNPYPECNSLPYSETKYVKKKNKNK